jgi:catechol 2,3-dioxygenase-like lactoylglutathione lyase family enzyme
MIHRIRVALLLALVPASLWMAWSPIAATPQAPPVVSAVDAIGVTVADMDRSVAFYRDVLGFERLEDTRLAGEAWDRLHGIEGAQLRVVGMRLGEERIELAQWLTPRGRPVPRDSRSHDRWFQHVAIIVNDMDQAYLRLQRHHVERISSLPQRLPASNPAAGGIRAFYFKDPDGHPLELLQFPPDKGDARWRRPSERVFLGIDHTAITVRDTETSLRFYRDALGLRVAGESWNSGIEQERLNDVAGARVRITTLRAAGGPAVEFLEYLSPRDGRGLPKDARANDLVHWQTIMTGDVARAIPLMPSRAGEMISRGAMTTPGTLGFARAFVVRDPDGHAVQVRSR